MSGLFTPFPEWSFQVNDKGGARLPNPLRPWSDAAILTANEDQFERAVYASKVAGLIRDTADPRESTIYGLTGEWGSGKTSLVNLIRKDLTQLSGRWEVVDYNPWVASDPEALIEEFYRAVAEALPADVIGKNIKNILRKTFRTIGPMAGILGSIGALDQLAVSAVVNSIKGLREVEKTWESEQDSWPTLYAKASKEFNRLDKQILLIVDDIDRLHADELALLMKVVRLLGRFPRVNYLLIYDEESLLTTLVESTAVGGDKNDALRFMEKIVQYPIDVPQLTSHQIEKNLRKIFDALPSDATQSDEREDLSIVQREMFGVWERVLTTPRSLRRYAALLENWLKIYDPGSVNTGDLMILATIRIVFPSVYANIPLYKKSLLSNSPPLLGHTFSVKNNVEFKWEEELAKDIDAPQGELLEVMLCLLFPKLKSDTVISGRNERPRAISNEVYFDTYVLFQAPSHVISDQSLGVILSDLDTDGAIALADLINSDDVEKISSVVAKLPEVIKRLQDDVLIFRAARVLIKAAEDIGDKNLLIRMTNVYRELYLQASVALGALDNLEEINVFDQFFQNTPLNFAVYFMDKIKYYSQMGDEKWGQSQSYEEIYSRCVERVREVLDKKEETDRDLGPYSLGLLAQWHEFNDFKSTLAADLDANKFDIVDVGVLFLSTVYLIGEEPRQEKISSFNRELFSKYVTVDRQDSVQASLQQEDIHFSPSDLSWMGRREAVKYALKTGRNDFLRERLGE